MFLKIGLADDIFPNGHLFVGKNYSKRKQLKKLSDRVLICSQRKALEEKGEEKD